MGFFEELFGATNERTSADIDLQVSHNIRCTEALSEYTYNLSLYEVNTLVMSLNSLQEQIAEGSLKECAVGCRTGRRVLKNVGRGIVEFVEDSYDETYLPYLPSMQQSLYDLYSAYMNEDSSVASVADEYGINEETAKAMLKEGKQITERVNKEGKAIEAERDRKNDALF